MIVVDANVWVSRYINDDAFHLESRRWLRRTLRGQDLREPTIVLPEVGGAISKRSRDQALADRAVQEVLAIPRLRIVDVDADLAREAADVAARVGLRGADAVYVALAVRLRCPLFTWDNDIVQRTVGVADARYPAV